jgi:hypothetical protein
MSDLKFDEARLKDWQKDVDNEFEMVKRLLREINDTIYADPIEGDTVLEWMADANDKLSEAWTTLGNGFDQIKVLAEGLFRKASEGVQTAMDAVDNFAKKIGL